MQLFRTVVYLLFIINVFSCEESYTFETDKYDSLLVVDGRITTDMPPYKIRLSRSTSISKFEAIPVSGARMSIVDDTGNVEKLKEGEKGIYWTSSSGMRGEIGRKYQLRITTEGIDYISNFEPILDTLSIGEVNGTSYNYISEFDFKEYQGLQFSLKNLLTEQDTNNYLVEIDETYKYNAGFWAEYKWVGKIKPNENSTKYYTCWKSSRINSFFLFDNYYKKGGEIDIPLQFVSSIGDELRVRYSLNLKQHTISKAAHQYFEEVNSLISDKSSLYSVQGYQINGNVKNIDNPEEPVLGYFYASGKTEKRFFFNRPYSMIFKDRGCIIDYEAMRFISYIPSARWPIPLVVGDGGGIGRAYSECIDCREAGGDIYKPNFWID